MCMKREGNERLTYPWPMFEIIDLTMDEFAEDDSVADNAPRNYPYNLLPTNDEDEQAISFVDFLADEEFQYSASDLDFDTPNEANLSTNSSSASSLNINFNIADSSDTDESNERHAFELNIPQILLSMSRISNNLHGRASTSQD